MRRPCSRARTRLLVAFSLFAFLGNVALISSYIGALVLSPPVSSRTDVLHSRLGVNSRLPRLPRQLLSVRPSLVSNEPQGGAGTSTPPINFQFSPDAFAGLNFAFNLNMPDWNFTPVEFKATPFDFFSKDNQTNRQTPSNPRVWCRDCIDIVIPYVNGSDPWYIKALSDYTLKRKQESGETSYDISTDASGPQRYRDSNELIYCLRAIEKFVPWVRRIHLITNGDQVPVWLDKGHPKISIVPHRILYPSFAHHHLPTFNIYAIKAHLHRIPGLAPKFIYVEDDQFFFRPISTAQFYNFSSQTTFQFVESHLPVNQFYGFLAGDNSEWRAIKAAAHLLHRTFPQPFNISYPVHGPFLTHRELYREAMEEVWPTESLLASSDRSRGVHSVETRTLVPYYQKFRSPRSFNASSFFRTYMDADMDGVLNEQELDGLYDYLQTDQTNLRTLLGSDSFRNWTLDHWRTFLEANSTQSLLARTLFVDSFDFWENSYKRIEPGPFEAVLTQVSDALSHTLSDFLVVFKKLPAVDVVGINDNIHKDSIDGVTADVVLRFFEYFYPDSSSFEKDTVLIDEYAQRTHDALMKSIGEFQAVPLRTTGPGLPFLASLLKDTAVKLRFDEVLKQSDSGYVGSD